MKLFCTLLLLIGVSAAVAQGNPEDYYYEIPEAPDSYTEGSVAGRIVDGLGFRYYWATEGLRPEDHAFKPSEEARTVGETIDHIVVLTQILLEAVNEKPFGGIDMEGMSYEEKRLLTLENIRKSSEKVKGLFSGRFAEVRHDFCIRQ